MAARIHILSAGAVQPGLSKVIERFRRDGGAEVTVNFATAPAIAKRIGAGETIDIVIAPRSFINEMAERGQVASPDSAMLGRIGVGVMVRDGVRLPKIAAVEEFKQSLIGADSLIFNQASTGLYLESLFEQLGIAEQVKNKMTRYPDFAAVLTHVSQGRGNEIGFGATTVIIENASKGVRFAGPLPEEIQNYTAYAAALTANTSEGAHAFVRYLATPAAKGLLAAAGIQ